VPLLAWPGVAGLALMGTYGLLAAAFGAATPPKYIPPFAWGGAGGERMTEDGFLRVAERVMARRNVSFSPERRESLRRAFERNTPR